MSVLAIAFSLFIIIDPIGNIPVCISLLKGFSIDRQQRILLREHIIAFTLLLLCHFVGDLLLSLLHVSQASLFITSGIILLLIALRMIFPSRDQHNKESLDEEPLITPIAVPLIAGPSAMATIMLLAGIVESDIHMMISILLACLSSFCILVCSPYLPGLIGTRAITAMERLMGMILTLISIERFLSGIKLFIADLN